MRESFVVTSNRSPVVDGSGNGQSEVTFLPLTFFPPRVDLAANIEWKRKFSTSKKICGAQPSTRARASRADDQTYDDSDETARDGVFTVSGESHAGDKLRKLGPDLAHSEKRSTLERTLDFSASSLHVHAFPESAGECVSQLQLV